jgi:RHS repeat-associated protein
MVFDESGALANVKRHDYLPFGEELFASQGLRTATLGYSAGDGIRQQFTAKERDVETGLDYFLARYYSSTQARFTSPDEFAGGPDELYYFAEDASDNPTFYADLTKPQSLNKYQYSYNNPLRWVDPDGHDLEEPEPQDPRPVVLLPAIPGTPPLVVPGGPVTSTSKVPNDATIVQGAKTTLDTVCDYTGITALADWLRPIIWPTPAPNPGPAPSTSTPPQQNQQPLPAPAPIQSKGEVKSATRTPGGVTPGKTISDKQAANRLKSGGDTVSSSRAKARQVAKKASPGGQVVHHKPHASGYRGHYHDRKHKNGHSFF